MFPKAFKKGADVGDVGLGIGIEDYDLIEVGGDAIDVLDDLDYDFDEQ